MSRFERRYHGEAMGHGIVGWDRSVDSRRGRELRVPGAWRLRRAWFSLAMFVWWQNGSQRTRHFSVAAFALDWMS